MFEKKFDVVVIGSGSGMNVGAKAIERGMKVAVVEHGLWGGTCLNVGCIPSKLLIYPADVAATIQESEKFGIKARIDSIDFNFVMERTREHVRGEREPIERAAMHSRSFVWYRETGQFVGDYTLKVGKEKIKGKKIFIASGTRPLVPKFPGIDKTEYLTSDTVLQLTQRPERVVIIGGGFVGVEYAHFFSSMGSDVTVVEMGPRLVAQEEPEISQLLFEEMSKRMTVLLSHRVEELSQSGEVKKVRATDLSTGRDVSIEADAIMVAVGRVPNSDLLQPEKTGVETDQRGFIKVNEYLETTKPNIWAFGDAIGKYMYRHAANYEAEIAWINAFGEHGHKIAVDFSAIPPRGVLTPTDRIRGAYGVSGQARGA